MNKRIFLTLAFITITVTTLLAQSDPGLPCGGADQDDNNCPLDTWVIVLAAVVMIFTAIHLARKQKAAINAA